VPASLDRAVRERVRERCQTLNEVLLEALRCAFGRGGEPPPPALRRDRSDIVGTWQDDAEPDRVLQLQRRVDTSEWRSEQPSRARRSRR
jgi:hypothetical protein